MYQLNLGFDNNTLYRGCNVEEFEPGRFRLNTSLDSAVVILAENLRELLKAVPEKEKDLLVLTGAVPPAIFLTAYSVLSPFFAEVEHFDGNRRSRVVIPPSSI